MTITDPQPALAEQSSFIGYLVGLAGLGGSWCGRWPYRAAPARIPARTRRMTSYTCYSGWPVSALPSRGWPGRHPTYRR